MDFFTENEGVKVKMIKLCTQVSVHIEDKKKKHQDNR